MKAARCARPRREIAEIIQAAFADRDDPRQAQELAQLARSRDGSKLGGVMRMDARRAPQHRGCGRRARAAARELARSAPVTTWRATPASSARAITASRSAAKLAWVRFAPMSISSPLKNRHLVVISCRVLYTRAERESGALQCGRVGAGLVLVGAAAGARRFAPARRRAATCRRRSSMRIRPRTATSWRIWSQNLDAIRSRRAAPMRRCATTWRTREYRCGLLAEHARRREARRRRSPTASMQLKPCLDQDAQVGRRRWCCSPPATRELAEHRHLEAVLLRSRPDERLEAALELAPRNPARCSISRPWTACATPSRGSRRAATGLRAAAAGGAAVRRRPRPPASTLPGWGHAEAYLALGTAACRRAAICSARATGSRNP